MSNLVNGPPEVVVPAHALTALRRTLEAELGPDRAAAAIRQTGRAAADALAPLFDDAAEWPAAEFWRRLADLLARRGWGTLEHEDPHPGVGALDSPDWSEADPSAGAHRPSCFFTTGLLASLLGRIAGDDADIGVLEVECRSRGDLRCRFLFGAHAALERVHHAVAAGRDAATALAELA